MAEFGTPWIARNSLGGCDTGKKYKSDGAHPVSSGKDGNVRRLRTPEKAIGDPTKFMLFEISNAAVLGAGLFTYHAPLSEQKQGIDNPAHAVIIGMSLDDDILPGILARKSRRV
ncbi:MAG: hypothetical protein H6569_10665 [Lewinellaceae bacterium]|nr:hypothetical protein [Lewinellaceae bacterium]